MTNGESIRLCSCACVRARVVFVCDVYVYVGCCSGVYCGRTPSQSASRASARPSSHLSRRSEARAPSLNGHGPLRRDAVTRLAQARRQQDPAQARRSKHGVSNGLGSRAQSPTQTPESDSDPGALANRRRGGRFRSRRRSRFAAADSHVIRRV
jgi:hypothetical protein